MISDTVPNAIDVITFVLKGWLINKSTYFYPIDLKAFITNISFKF